MELLERTKSRADGHKVPLKGFEDTPSLCCDAWRELKTTS